MVGIFNVIKVEREDKGIKMAARVQENNYNDVHWTVR